MAVSLEITLSTHGKIKLQQKSNFLKSEAIQFKLPLEMSLYFQYFPSVTWYFLLDKFDKLDSLEKANVLTFQVEGLATNWSCF